MINKIIGLLLLTGIVSCGVKGPPEPPLPTEASLKKDMDKKETELKKKKQDSKSK